jgi:predicted nucleic acid-binding protein
VSYLIDTSVLARLANTSDGQYSLALSAVVELHRRDEVLYITPQVLIEFRSVATRPKEFNGLGMTVAEAGAQAAIFEAVFPLLPETSDVFPAWKQIVDALGVVGKQVHDARLLAICHVHGVPDLLTFNVGHFSRMALSGPKVNVAAPHAVVSGD